MKHRPCKRLTDLCFVFFNTTFFGLRPITHFGNPTPRPFRLTITNWTKLAKQNHFLFEKHGLRPHHSQFPIVGRANVQSARVDFHRVFHTCASIISLRPVPQWPVLLRPLSYRTFIVLRNGIVDAISLEGRGEIGHSYEYVIRSNIYTHELYILTKYIYTHERSDIYSRLRRLDESNAAASKSHLTDCRINGASDRP